MQRSSAMTATLKKKIDLWTFEQVFFNGIHYNVDYQSQKINIFTMRTV